MLAPTIHLTTFKIELSRLSFAGYALLYPVEIEKRLYSWM